MTMDALLVATGFTGALTLAWLFRMAAQRLRPAPGVSVSFAPAGGCGDVLAREIGAARREVLVLAGQLACRPLAQALVEARMRGATVEVVLDPASQRDPASDLPFLTEQGLTPVLAGKPGLHHHFVIVDGQTLLTASFPLVSRADSELAGSLLVFRGHSELLRTCHEEFALHKGSARPAEGKPAPQPAPVEKTPAPATPPPVRPSAPPFVRPASEILASVAALDIPAGEATTPEPEAGSTTDLLARLRKQLGEPEEEDAAEAA